MKYIILDLDHTLCDTPIGISIDEFHDLDHASLLPKWDVINKLSVQNLTNRVTILYLTSRCISLYFNTSKWIYKNCYPIDTGNYWHLFMRSLDDLSPPHTMKLNLLEGLDINPKDVIFWLDDDEKTILRGRSKGYNVVHPNHFLAGVS